MKNIYTYCGVCVKSSDMHLDEVKDTPKELRYYVKMDIVPENNIFKKIQDGQRSYHNTYNMRKVSYLVCFQT